MGSAIDTERVEYDENDDNGLVLANQYIPTEILSDIFIYYTDEESLLKCQAVCRRWHDLIKSYIWRKKAEILSNCSLPLDLQWSDYHAIYHKQPFGRNLIQNHSGELGRKKHWLILENGGDRWTTEATPIGAPSLPEDPFFNNSQYCFVTSYSDATKVQTIDLVKNGIPQSILDTNPPNITISEWYCSRFDCPAEYRLTVSLYDNNFVCIENFDFEDSMRNDRQNVWFQKKHVFKNYAAGVRKIRFLHGGRDNAFWKGHYGCKMARACIICEMPKNIHDQTINEEFKKESET